MMRRQRTQSCASLHCRASNSTFIATNTKSYFNSLTLRDHFGCSSTHEHCLVRDRTFRRCAQQTATLTLNFHPTLKEYTVFILVQRGSFWCAFHSRVSDSTRRRSLTDTMHHLQMKYTSSLREESPPLLINFWTGPVQIVH